MEEDQAAWEERCLRDGVLRGDEGAWGVLYHRAFHSLHAYVRARVGDEMDLTEEVIQETWMIALRRLRTFDPSRGRFEAWLLGIGENVLRNQFRRRHRSRRPGPLTLEVVDRAPSPRAATSLAGRIARALTTLPWHYQEVLRARYEESQPVARIASRSGLTPKAVESLLSRARQAFREAWRRQQG